MIPNDGPLSTKRDPASSQFAGYGPVTVREFHSYMLDTVYYY